MSKTPLEIAKEALDSVISERKRNQELLRSIGPAVVDALKPALEDLARNSKMTKDELVKAVSGLSINIPPVNMPRPEITVNVPEIKSPVLPTINVPEPRVTVNVPPMKIPDIIMPDEMNIGGWVKLQGVDLGHPLPVQLRDADGRPVNLLENLTTLISGGSGGGKHDYFTIKGFSKSAFAEIMNPDGRLRVEMPAGAAGLTDIELRAAHLDVQQLSGSIDSVYVTGSSGSLAATIVDSDGNQYSGSNPLPVAAYIDSTQGQGDTDSRTLRVVHAGDSGLSTYVRDLPIAYNQGDTDGRTIRVVQAGDSISSVYVSGFAASVAATIIDSAGAGYCGSNPFPVTVVSGGTATSGVNVVDSSGVAYTTTNPLPVNIVSGAGATSAVNISDSSGVGYSGSNPLPTYNVGAATQSTYATTVGSDASTQIATTNIDRKSIIITHQNSLALYVSTGTAVSTTSFPLLANQIIGWNEYVGPLYAILTEGGATAKVTIIEV